MAIQIINTGTSANAGNGDSIRTAFTKVNQNFDLLNGMISGTGTNFNSGVRNVVKPMFLHDRHDGITAEYNSINDQIILSPTPGTVGVFNNITVINTSTLRDIITTGTVAIETNQPNSAKLSLRNLSDLSSATSDLIFVRDDGNLEAVTGVMNLGINSSNYEQQLPFGIHTPGSAYMFTNDADLIIGTQTPGTRLVFHVDGTSINDSAGILDGYAWTFNRNVQVIVPTPGPLNFTVWNTENNSAAQAIYQATNNSNSSVRLGINSINPDALFGNIGPGESFLHNHNTTATLHIGNRNDLVFYSNELTGFSGTPTLVMSRIDRSSTFSGDLIPASDVLYNLGSADKQWRSLYVGTSTIYLGGVPLGIADGQLTVNDSPILTRSDRLTSGTSTLTLASDGSLVLDQQGAYDNVEVPGTLLRIDTDKPNYTQISVKNNSDASTATSDLIFARNDGDVSSGSAVLDIGINSSNYIEDNVFGLHSPGSAYMFTNDADLVIGTQTPGSRLIFHAGGSTSNDSALVLDGYAWRFNRSVQVVVPTPGPLNFTVWNTQNNSAAQAVYQAINNAGEYIHFGINSSNPGAVFGNIGPGESFLHNHDTTATLHIGSEGDLAFYSNESDGYSGTATLYMSRADRSSTFGGHVLPASDLAYDLGSLEKQWRSLYVGTSTIFIGGVPIRVNTATNTLAVGTSTNSLETNLATESYVQQAISQGGGGGGGPVMPYLELTNAPFIIQAVTQGDPVQFTRTADGSQVDEIDTGLTLARGSIRGLYNAESEEAYNNITHASPAGTEWNADGWGTLIGFNTRTYTTLREALDGAIGENIVGAELIMHDTINDKYYKFLFSNWGENNGGSFAYTRTLITDPNYFRKKDDGEEIDIFVEDSPLGSGIGITRGAEQGIYNPYQEEGWNNNTSPAGTEWNLDGWDDLTNIESRTYTNFYNAYGNGGLGNKVPGSKALMYVPSTDTYYAIQWLTWSQGGYGVGFSYIRNEVDLTKLNEGVKFADGTVQKTAYVGSNVKHRASGNRRIEEVYGDNTVSVTEVTYGEGTMDAIIRNTSNSWDFYVNATETLNALYNEEERSYRYFEFSFDNETTWIPVTFGGGSFGNYYQMVFEDNVNRPVTEGDTVRYRVVSGGEPVTWWDKNDLPGGSSNFRGAIIDYHAYTGEATWIGTIHIADDDGDETITHTEVSSGSTDSMNDDLWYVTSEGKIQYRRFDGEGKTLKVQWGAKVFYGSEYYD